MDEAKIALNFNECIKNTNFWILALFEEVDNQLLLPIIIFGDL